MNTIEALNANQQLANVRLAAVANQVATYTNGPLNNGVGARLTFATGVLTIDGVNVLLGDYVLLAGQTNGYENGIYECIIEGSVGISAVLQRRGDFQNIEQVREGHYVPVAAGGVFAGAMFCVIEPLPRAIGVPIVATANNINFATITAAASSLYLQRANNLSDVIIPSTALANIGGLPLVGADVFLAGPKGFPMVVANVTVGQAALAGGGAVTLLPSAAAHQYQIVDLFLNSGGTNFSGGGGDRLGQVTDGATVYSVIPAADMQALTNQKWGTTSVPAPAAAPYNTLTAAGAPLTFMYSGGTTDYTAGSVVITVVAALVA